MEWVWIIGGGTMQIPVIKEAKRRGYAVMVSDGSKSAPGINYADKFIHISTYDVDENYEFAKCLTVKPRAVLTDAADIGPTVSAVCGYYGFPAATHEAAIKTRNKAFMRGTIGFGKLDRPVDKGINSMFSHPLYVSLFPLPKNTIWGQVARCLSIPSSLYPLVVKPADSSASRGISKICNKSELEDAIDYAATFNHDSEYVVLEECLSGEEVSLDFFIVNGKAIYANGAKRIFGKFGIELGHTNPFIPNEPIINMATQAASALGVDRGPFKMDLINDPRYGWCILECATRLSGGHDHAETCVMATGKDIVGAALDFALGLPLDMNKLTPKWNKYACALANEAGDYKSCADRTVFAIAEGNTEAEAIDNARRLL